MVDPLRNRNLQIPFIHSFSFTCLFHKYIWASPRFQVFKVSELHCPHSCSHSEHYVHQITVSIFLTDWASSDWIWMSHGGHWYLPIQLPLADCFSFTFGSSLAQIQQLLQFKETWWQNYLQNQLHFLVTCYFDKAFEPWALIQVDTAAETGRGRG